MSYKSQLFPLSSVRVTSWRQRISHSWGSGPANLEDMKFLRSWQIYGSKLYDFKIYDSGTRDSGTRDSTTRDSGIGLGVAQRRFNWKTLLAFALATALSSGIWAGIGLMFAHTWK